MPKAYTSPSFTPPTNTRRRQLIKEGVIKIALFDPLFKYKRGTNKKGTV